MLGCIRNFDSISSYAIRYYISLSNELHNHKIIIEGKAQVYVLVLNVSLSNIQENIKLITRIKYKGLESFAIGIQTPEIFMQFSGENIDVFHFLTKNILFMHSQKQIQQLQPLRFFIGTFFLSFFMKRLFGKKKDVPQQPQVSLEDTSDQLGRKSESIDKEIAEINRKLSELTKQMKMPSNKSRVPTLRRKATELLKRRKMLEGFQGKIDGQRFNIDNMAFQQQQMKVNIETVNAMKETNATMKQTMKQFTVEDVDDMAMDMEDMMAESNEISDILSQGIGNDIDEGELEDELAALEAEGLDEGDLDMEGLDDTGGKTPQKEAW